MAEENTGNEKATWRPKFLSEFSMGQLDFNRYDKTLTELDAISAAVNSYHVPTLELMQQFLAHLINLYDNWRPLISIGTVADELDNLIKEGISKKRVWERLQRQNVQMNEKRILEFVDLCNKIKRRLLQIKQVVGLGIVVRKNMTPSERIKKGIRGFGKIGSLPEA